MNKKYQAVAAVAIAYRVYVVALVEMESPLHADTLTAQQLPKHQLTSMAWHCKQHTVWADASMLMFYFSTLVICSIEKAVFQLTSAGGKMWNIFILEHIPVTQQLSQAPQARPTDDGYFRTLLCVGQQPVCCLLILFITVSAGKNIDKCNLNTAVI